MGNTYNEQDIKNEITYIIGELDKLSPNSNWNICITHTSRTSAIDRLGGNTYKGFLFQYVRINTPLNILLENLIGSYPFDIRFTYDTTILEILEDNSSKKHSDIEYLTFIR